MGEAVLNSFCRLCLRGTFSLSNIFSSQSPSGELMYDVLNYVYDLKICPDDGLPPLICAPCSWKMHEFNSYKLNVHFAKEEIIKLLDEIRPVSTLSIDVEVDTQLGSDTNPPVNVREEIEIEEWQMPEELKRPMDTERNASESVLHSHGNIMNIHHEPASSEVKSQGIVIELKQEELIIEEEETIQTTASSGLTNILSVEASEGAVGSLFKGESICTTQGISVEIRDTNKGIHEEDLRDEIVPEEESLSSEMTKSILDVRTCGRSHLEAPLSMRKTGFICDICKKSFTAKQFLGNHVRVHYDERPLSCSKCDKTFESDKVLYVHELRHLRGKMSLGKTEKETKVLLYSCDLCELNFNSKKGLWRHSNMHSNKYKCNSCGRCFGDSAVLRAHLRTHTKDKPFKCSKCDKRFKSDIGRYKHELRHLRDEINIGKSEKGAKKMLYSCNLCDKNFNSKKGLRRHSNLHSNKYKCNSCGRCFGDNAVLRAHLRTHSKEKPFKCKVCLKCFSLKQNLNEHLLIHSSERPYFCDICDKRFRTKRGKNNHELIHLRKK